MIHPGKSLNSKITWLRGTGPGHQEKREDLEGALTGKSIGEAGLEKAKIVTEAGLEKAKTGIEAELEKTIRGTEAGLGTAICGAEASLEKPK